VTNTEELALLFSDNNLIIQLSYMHIPKVINNGPHKSQSLNCFSESALHLGIITYSNL